MPVSYQSPTGRGAPGPSGSRVPVRLPRIGYPSWRGATNQQPQQAMWNTGGVDPRRDQLTSWRGVDPRWDQSLAWNGDPRSPSSWAPNRERQPGPELRHAATAKGSLVALGAERRPPVSRTYSESMMRSRDQEFSRPPPRNLPDVDNYRARAAVDVRSMKRAVPQQRTQHFRAAFQRSTTAKYRGGYNRERDSGYYDEVDQESDRASGRYSASDRPTSQYSRDEKKIYPNEAIQIEIATDEVKTGEAAAEAETTPTRSTSAEQRELKDQQNEGLIRDARIVKMLSSRKEVQQRYSFDSVLGEGNFAVVLKSRRIEDGKLFAVKEVDKQKLGDKLFYIENEVALLSKCDHPSIIRLIEAMQTTESFFIIMELVENGDLFDCVKSRGCLTERQTALALRDVASALTYLHAKKIVHRDIKPENLMLRSAKNFQITLIDFGLACTVLGPLKRICGTPTYVAPEIITEEGYGLEVDMWSLGVIAYICFVGYAPFRGDDRTKLFQTIKQGKFSLASAGWETVSKGAQQLVARMLTLERSSRCTARGVLADRWLVENATQLEPDELVAEDRYI